MYLKIVITSLLVLASYQFSLSQNINIDQIKNFKIDKIEGKQISLSFTTYFENPTKKNVGITIKKGKLFKDGQYLGSFRFQRKVKLGKGTKEPIHIHLIVDLEKEINLLQEGLSMLFGNKPEVKMTGKYKVSWLIFSKKFPFEYKEKISFK